MHYGWGMMWFGWIFWLAVIIVIIWLVFRTSSERRGWHRDNQLPETPLDILKKRYAKGEINKDEYERIKSDIKS